jgi:CelD/BcsL family acetyltransferase involved in cellulose biosynthesis
MENIGPTCAANYSVRLQTCILDNLYALQRLQPDWSELHTLDHRGTPFQSPAWLIPWWEAFGSGRLFTLAVFDGSALVGLAPLFIHPWQDRRQVTLLGNGLSDRLGLLIRPGYDNAVLYAVFAALLEVQDHWDLCDFRDLDAADPLLTHTPPPGLRISSEDLSPCFAIRLPATAEAFDASLASAVRRNLRHYRRDFHAHGPLSFETISGPHGFDEAFAALLRFHKLRRGDDGSFTPEEEAFHLSAARLELEAGGTRLCVLRSGHTICALIYGLVRRDRFYACLGAFNPDFAEFRPGWLVLDFAVKSAIAEGLTWFDFLRGDEEYKKLWRAEPYMTRRIFLWHQ